MWLIKVKLIYSEVVNQINTSAFPDNENFNTYIKHHINYDNTKYEVMVTEKYLTVQENH
jgi:hypothetical protein